MRYICALFWHFISVAFVAAAEKRCSSLYSLLWHLVMRSGETGCFDETSVVRTHSFGSSFCRFSQPFVDCVAGTRRFSKWQPALPLLLESFGVPMQQSTSLSYFPAPLQKYTLPEYSSTAETSSSQTLWPPPHRDRCTQRSPREAEGRGTGREQEWRRNVRRWAVSFPPKDGGQKMEQKI